MLRYGAYSEAVVQKLKWMENVLYPTLKRAIARLGRIDLKNIIAQALHMGDEVHNRNRAATSILYRMIAPAIVTTCDDAATVSEALEFVNRNDHFFLNLSMPASKVTLDAARGIRNSSIVVVMSRNGTDFGIQLSGTGDESVHGPANVPDALFFPGIHESGREPGHWRQRDHGNQRAGGIRHCGVARDRPIRRGKHRRRDPVHTPDV